MEPEICSEPGGKPGQDTPIAPRRTAARLVDGRAADRHPWAIAALLVPLAFCAIVGVGVFLMFHRNMGYFKPAPSGQAAPAAAPATVAGAWPIPAGGDRPTVAARPPTARA
jgi:hypothetical protein